MRWHDWIALTDKAANADGARGGDVRRGYWFILAAFGVWGLLEGLGIFLGGFVSHLGGQAPLGGALGNLAPLASLRGQDWMQTLFPPLAQIVIAAVVVWLFWWPSQKAAAGGDADERSSKIRSLLIHLTVLIMSIVALSGLIQILQEVLSRLLQGGSRGLIVLSLYDPIAQVIVGALASWYFFARVRSTLPTPRLSEYIIAGVAFLLGLAAVINLVTALLLTLGGRGQRIEDILVNALPGLLVGGLILFWRWRVIHRETLPPPQPVIAGSAEDTLPPTPIPSPAGSPRIDVWRKVYLYVYQLGGLLLVLVGSISILQYLIASILGQPSVGRAANFLADLSSPLAMLIVGGLLSFFMLRINVDDARASGMSTEEVMRQTLGDNLPSWAIALAAYILIGPVLLILVLATLGPAIGNIFSNIAGQLK